MTLSVSLTKLSRIAERQSITNRNNWRWGWGGGGGGVGVGEEMLGCS